MNKNKEEKIQYVMDELIENGNLDVINEIYSADYVAHAGEKNFNGHNFLNRFAKQLRKSIPDIHTVDVKILANETDTIVWQRTLEGTHKVKMQGIPASGKKMKWVEMIVSRFNNEKIVEEWVVSELMGQMLLKASKA